MLRINEMHPSSNPVIKSAYTFCRQCDQKLPLSKIGVRAVSLYPLSRSRFPMTGLSLLQKLAPRTAGQVRVVAATGPARTKELRVAIMM
jgi:hypothetical protein